MSKKEWLPPLEFSIDEAFDRDQKTTQKSTTPTPIPIKPGVIAEASQPEFAQLFSLDKTPQKTTDRPNDSILWSPTQSKRKNLKWFVCSLLIFIAAIIVLDTYQFLQEQFTQSFIIGTLFATLFLVLVVTASSLLYREVQEYKKVKNVASLQQACLAAQSSSDFFSGQKLVGKISKVTITTAIDKTNLERFQSSYVDSHSSQEMLDLYSRIVLQTKDKKAFDIVTNHAVNASILTAISPFVLLDSAIMLWRNGRMINEIAQSYGGRPGFFGTMVLVRHAVSHIAIAGASEFVTDGAVEALGGQLASAISVRAGQGIINGLLTAKLGLLVMGLSRPIPFTSDNKPRLKDIRDHILKGNEPFFKRKKYT